MCARCATTAGQQGKIVDNRAADFVLTSSVHNCLSSLLQVNAIPYTRSGKKVELAVKDLIAGIEPKNVGALQDPTAFDEYREMAKSWS